MAWARSFSTVEELSAAIDKAVQDSLMERVAPGLKQEVAKTAEERVYNAYTPKFYSRYGTRGGVLDQDLMFASRSGMELILDIEVPWQNEKHPHQELDLIDAIEQTGIYGAPPRPYIEAADQEYENSGKADKDMQQGLSAARL